MFSRRVDFRKFIACAHNIILFKVPTARLRLTFDDRKTDTLLECLYHIVIMIHENISKCFQMRIKRLSGWVRLCHISCPLGVPDTLLSV